LRHSPGNREVVGRAVYGEFTDRAAGKPPGLHDERIGGQHQALAAWQRDHRTIAQRFQQRVAERLDEHRVDQCRRGLATGPMRQRHMIVDQPGTAFAKRLDPLNNLALVESRSR
jgi:hypothetical protein